MSPRPRDRSRSLVDHAVGPSELGPPTAVLATTFDLGPDFVEGDFLPAVMRVPSADDRKFRSRIQLEAALGRTSAVALLCEARCYRARPASLRVHVTPAIAKHAGYLHAKVALFVHEDAVRLLVTSANLTVNGYRQNREVAFCITAEKKAPEATRLVRDAVAAMRGPLHPWWSDTAEEAVRAAEATLATLPVKGDNEDDFFAWSGPASPLWRRLIDVWPSGEEIQSIRIVSPFWSEEPPRDGPLQRFVGALRGRSATKGEIRVELVTPASPAQGGQHLPILPESFRSLQPSSWNARVQAVAAQPYVGDDDDVKISSGAKLADGTTIVERRLHAKVVLIEGKTTSVAYLGSANFTSPGWGFGNPSDSHVEAGMILRRRRTARESLRKLIPPLAGKPVELGGAAAPKLAAQGAEECPSNVWPEFIRDARLVPRAGAAVLDLVVTLHPEVTPASWSIRYVEGGLAARTWSDEPAESEVTLSLTAEDLKAIFRRKAILVGWSDQEIAVPVNVALEARDQVPFGDGSANPRENELIAFFQGKLAVEDVFPPPEAGDEEEDGETGGAEAAASAVDTSKILSYQIRSFVEALPGMREVLLRECSTPSGIRLSILGPVSPLALAKEVQRAAKLGRSPVAAGFQLVELQRCLRELRSAEVADRVREVWRDTLEEADRRVGEMAAELRVAPQLGAGTTFDRYASLVLKEGGAS